MAKGVIVRILPFVAIPHHQASGSMNYGIIHAMYYGLFVPSMCWRKLLRNAYKGGLYFESKGRCRENVSV
jgi:hypothetical protein